MEATPVDVDMEGVLSDIDALLALTHNGGGGGGASSKLLVRCCGLDGDGRPCTRTRWLARTTFYRLHRKNRSPQLLCARHSQSILGRHHPDRRRRRCGGGAACIGPWKVAGASLAGATALCMLVACIYVRVLWLCTLGLALGAVACLCVCLLAAERLLLGLLLGGEASTPGPAQEDAEREDVAARV